MFLSLHTYPFLAKINRNIFFKTELRRPRFCHLGTMQSREVTSQLKMQTVTTVMPRWAAVRIR